MLLDCPAQLPSYPLLAHSRESLANHGSIPNILKFGSSNDFTNMSLQYTPLNIIHTDAIFTRRSPVSQVKRCGHGVMEGSLLSSLKEMSPTECGGNQYELFLDRIQIGN